MKTLSKGLFLSLFFVLSGSALAETCTMVMKDYYGNEVQRFTRYSYSYNAACDEAQYDCKQDMAERQVRGGWYGLTCSELYTPSYPPSYPTPYPPSYPPSYPNPYPPSYPAPYPPRYPDPRPLPPRDPHWPDRPDPRDPRDPHRPEWPREPRDPRDPHWPRH